MIRVHHRGVTGRGTPGRLPKFTAEAAIADSLLSESGDLLTLAGMLDFNGLHGRLAATVTVVTDLLDKTLFPNVSAALVLLRNFSVGGAAVYLVDATFPETPTLVAVIGNAFWSTGVPTNSQIRVFISGTTVVCRSGVLRTGETVTAVLLRVGSA